MRARLPLLSALLFAAAPAAASCGSYSCPIDSSALDERPMSVMTPGQGAPAAPSPRHLLLDASFQYIDQDAPRAGARRAAVGEIRNAEHDEVRTINRLLNLRADYELDERWGFSASLPLVSRTHDHVETATGDPEHWSFNGAGDLTLQARYAVLARATPESPVVRLSAGLKLPTGRTNAHDAAGEEADPSLQPGSGSWDTVWGASFQQNAGRAPTAAGDWAYVPVFASVLYRQNNPGLHGYRGGDDIQLNAGSAYTVLRPLDVLAQANYRVKRGDYAGRTSEDTSFTGGEYLYLSPGLRWRALPDFSVYGYLQLPVHQRVNKEQLTADRHWLFGVTWSLF